MRYHDERLRWLQENFSYIDSVTMIDATGKITVKERYNPRYSDAENAADNEWCLNRNLLEVFPSLSHSDSSLLQALQKGELLYRENQCTMGGAAVATTSFPVNRERVAELLGFDGFLENSMDATAALDFAYEPACAMAIFANNMGRMTESLLLWNINEVGISRLAAPYCSYSTIMPQKRNPVALETLRYSGEWTYGALMSMLAAMKAYPQGNGREPGFVVSLYYEIVQRMIDSAYLLEGIVRTLEVDKARALQVTADGFSTVTDLADAMVQHHDLSFSAAKKITGRVVTMAQQEKVSIHAIDSAFVARAAQEALGMELHMTEQEIHHALDPVENVTRRQVIGGPSPARVQEMIDKGHGAVERFEADWRSKRAYLDEKREALYAMAGKLAEEA